MITTAPETFEDKVATQIEQWDAEIEHLKARADLILAEMEERYYRVLRGLRQREQAVRDSLKELHHAHSSFREEAKRRLDQATTELKIALEAVPPELE